jgi:hypothetical protein
MNILLGNAESGDQSFDNIRLILFGGLWLAATAVMALIPIRIALRKQHRRAQIIVFVTILCGLLTVGSILLSLSAQEHWAHEDMLLLQTGYLDPHGHQHDPPPRPWAFWGGLAAVYTLMVIWSVAGKVEHPESA